MRESWEQFTFPKTQEKVTGLIKVEIVLPFLPKTNISNLVTLEENIFLQKFLVDLGPNNHS